MRKQNKGITLIALVITIIVLLILAGISIATLMGDDGVLAKAKQAKEEKTLGAIKEALNLYKANQLMQENTNTGNTPKDFAQDLVDKGIIKEKTEVTVDADGNVKYKEQTVGTINPDSSENAGNTGTTNPGEWNGKVNAPIVEQGMVPIKYDETKSNWVVCSQTDEEWYNYEEQKWANIMLSDETLTEGQTIEYDNLGSMFVWIPRYAYSITSGWHSSETGIIDVQFISKDTIAGSSVNGGTITDVAATDAESAKQWRIPPAFKYGENNEISGFYVAKFEASGTTEQLAVKPGGSSLRNITISEMFTACRNMGKVGNMDPHMLKNSEWGATAYLAHSEYGRNGTEVTLNNNSGYNTGGGTTEAYKSNTNQSTTGNITGIYDMSGGAIEYVAAYVNNESSNLTYYGNSLYTAESKYKDEYEKGSSDSRSDNYEANANKYGDAVYETSSADGSLYSWHDDYSNFPYSRLMFFMRGGRSFNGSGAGLFYFSYDIGFAYSYYSFRPVFSLDT